MWFLFPSNENGSEGLKATQSFCFLWEVRLMSWKEKKAGLSIPPIADTQGFLQHQITFQKQFCQKCDGLQAKADICLDYIIVLLMGGTCVHHALLNITSQASITLVNPTSPSGGHVEPEVPGCGEQHSTHVQWKQQSVCLWIHTAQFLPVTVKQSLYNHISSHPPPLRSARKLQVFPPESQRVCGCRFHFLITPRLNQHLHHTQQPREPSSYH